MPEHGTDLCVKLNWPLTQQQPGAPPSAFPAASDAAQRMFGAFLGGLALRDPGLFGT
jgi:predicted lipid-binding transport protein (Tim44 family)